MNRPLYAAAADEPAHREPAGHAGLWFDKFCNTWRRDGGAWTMKEDKESRERGADGNPKLEWLRTLIDGPVGAQDQIDEYALRIVRLVERRGGLAVVFKTDARFVTGLGRSHPVENGFAWHPTLGTPCLPGSSVKGMVRAWVDADPDPRPGAEETRDRLLGTPGRAGRLCFLDAVPTAPVRLEADVMTPHFAGWSTDDPPGDWRAPTPIPFLVTAAETRFLFGVLPVQPVDDGDLSTVETWLRDALAWAGAGAKTAVGYGRFGRDDEETARWKRRVGDEDRRRREERKRQAAMRTPEGRWRLELQGLSEAEVLDQVRVHLEKEPLPDACDRRAFANAVRSMNFVGHWRNGRTQDPRTGVGKKKIKERVRLLDDAACAEHDSNEQD